MTLDEAIKHCEEKARELRTSRAYTDIEGNLRATETCEECAREHEQLAEWLTELKLRRAEQVGIQLPNGILYAPELFNGCSVCDAHKTCLDAFCSNAINCNGYWKGEENG